MKDAEVLRPQTWGYQTPLRSAPAIAYGSLFISPQGAEAATLTPMISFDLPFPVVYSPVLLLNGRVSNLHLGIIQFINRADPSRLPLYFEVNNHCVKALLHLSRGGNEYEVQVFDGGKGTHDGEIFDLGNLVDSSTLNVEYEKVEGKKPLHFCLVLGADSRCEYDMPRYKLERGEVANLDTAVQRLKVAARMMQAFTQAELSRKNFGCRTFQVVEEEVSSKRIFGYNTEGYSHSEVKIHVIRSPLTVQELRKYDYAQQVPGAKDNGFLFGHAIDLVKNHEIYEPYKNTDSAIQCAVMYADSHWDQKYITAHAALGGGNGDVKMAIFGSHGLHSYPLTFAQMTPCLLDNTPLSTKDVANDSNECGTTWRCLNICMGAFMHEIGHLFGCPHQVDGVMLRDYVRWNRMFVTREIGSNNTAARLVENDGNFHEQCHWNDMDIVRFVYHDSFSITSDECYPEFRRVDDSYLRPQRGSHPVFYRIGGNLIAVRAPLGVYMFEYVVDELARYHVPFLPKCYGGNGPVYLIVFNFDDCLEKLRTSWDKSASDFSLRVMSPAGDLYIDSLRDACKLGSEDVIRGDFGLGRGKFDGYKSQLLGARTGDLRYISFDIHRVFKIRIYHGGAIDGISVYTQPSHPRLHLKHEPECVTLGSVTGNYSDFEFARGEMLQRIYVRNGGWIDAMMLETDKGRRSPMLGNTTGGHLTVLELPTPQQTIIGFYGHQSQWMDGFGIISATL